MMATKFGGISVQDTQVLDRVLATVPERPTNMAAKTQVSGHELTRAVQPKKEPGFSLCHTPQGLKAELFLPHTARLKSCPDTCFASRSKKVLPKDIHPPASLRASVSPWWGFSR
jgi:hypothetical protein